MRQTRGAIVESFNGMVLQRAYDTIHVADIIEEAGVGRSTFYEHFHNKDSLLRHAMSGLLSVLADAATEAGSTPRITHALEHFRENRRAARARLNGPSAAQVSGWLAELIELRLAQLCREQGLTLVIPVPLVAAQAAEAQIGLIRAWLDKTDMCPASTLAAAIQSTTKSAVSSLVVQGT